MPWKNKHQKKKQADKNKKSPQQPENSQQYNVKVKPIGRQNGYTAVQQLQSATRVSQRNGNHIIMEQHQQQQRELQSSVYYGAAHQVSSQHGNGARVQRLDRDEMRDRDTGQPLTQSRPQSNNAMTRQDYQASRAVHHAVDNQGYHRTRRSGSPGRDTEAYVRQLEYQQLLVNQQRDNSPSREAQLRYQLEYKRQQQQQRTVSPERAISPHRASSQRVASPHRAASPHKAPHNRNYRHSDYQTSAHQKRSPSPAKIREEQLRQIEYQRQLRKQHERQHRERRASSPTGHHRNHYTSTPTPEHYDQMSSLERRSRNDVVPRRALSSREQKAMDGIMEGGTLTREQRKFLIQQQRAFKAAQEKNQSQQQHNGKSHYARNDNVIRLSPEEIRQHHDSGYISRGQRSKSTQRLYVKEPSEERSKTASIIDERNRRRENRDMYSPRSGSLDRNNIGYQALMNDPRMQKYLSQSNGNLERLSQHQRNNNKSSPEHSPRSPDGGIPPEMLKMMQQRITRRSRSPGAIEAEKQRIREELRHNANQHQRQTRSSPPDSTGDRQPGWRNGVIEVKPDSNHKLNDHDIAINMAHKGMIVTIPYDNNITQADIHKSASSNGSPEKTSDTSVPLLVPSESLDPRKSPIPSPRSPARSPQSPRSVSSYNSLDSSKSGSLDSDYAPVPLPRRARTTRAKHKHRKSPSPGRDIKQNHAEEDSPDGRVITSHTSPPKGQSPTKSVKSKSSPKGSSNGDESPLQKYKPQPHTRLSKMVRPENTTKEELDVPANTAESENSRSAPIKPARSPRSLRNRSFSPYQSESPSPDSDSPVPKPRRKRSPRGGVSEKDTLTKAEAEEFMKNNKPLMSSPSPRATSPQKEPLSWGSSPQKEPLSWGSSPQKEPWPRGSSPQKEPWSRGSSPKKRPSTRESSPRKESPSKTLPGKVLFQNRRASMGLDNKPNHPEPTTIPEQNAQRLDTAAIVPLRYERRGSLGEVKYTVDTTTPEKNQHHQVNGKENTHEVSNGGNVASIVHANVSATKTVEDLIPKSSDSELQPGKFTSKDAIPQVNNSTKKESGMNTVASKVTEEKTQCEKSEPSVEEIIKATLERADESVLRQSNETATMVAQQPDDKYVLGQSNPSSQSRPFNDTNEIADSKEKHNSSVDDLPHDVLDRSTSHESTRSSALVTSNNSFTSKSSNEHELTDSLSDSTGSHILSPLAEDGDVDDSYETPPVPPPRFRRNRAKSARPRLASEDTTSTSESPSQDYFGDDFRGMSMEELREDEDKVPGLGEYPYVKKRSVKGDRAWMYTSDQMVSSMAINTGLRGLTSPTFQRKAKESRCSRQQKMLPGGHTNRMPRQPRPQRMQTIVEALKSGLKDSIKLNREKLQAMQQHYNDVKAARTRQGFHYNLDKQVKVAERYIRKLQFHLAKVEELQEQYEKELKVREGAVNMVKAYQEKPSPHKKEPVTEAKLGVKDCTQALCAMEAELEANLGAFVIKIEGIAGFARVCRGDIFEVGFKLGFQKYKSKCKVEKDLSQSWDGEEILLYPMVADFLTIKVTEIRGIARSNVVIGNLEFDTSDFYQAEAQNLTIDVNENGTIKLNVMATWSPFHIDEDDMKSPNKNSYHRRERAFTEPNISAGHLLSPENFNRSQSLQERSAPKPIDLGTNLVLTLEEAMHNVTRLLEILNGQYGELKTLEHNVDQLNTMLKDIAEKKKRESIVSLSVKSALESFDFLNEVEEQDQNNSDYEDSGSGSMEETNRRNTLDSTRSDSVISAGTDSTCSIDDFHPSSLPKNDTTPTKTDSQQTTLPDRPIQRKRGSKFIEMNEKRESRLLELNEQRGSKLFETLDRQSKKSSTENGSEAGGSVLTCGIDSVDMVLVQHLMYIEYLLSHLGAFGPLKLKETNALEKLHKQAVIIEQLITLCVTKMEITSPDEILPDLKLKLPLLEFWEQCTGKEVLLVKADDFLLQLDVKFGAKLRTDYPDIADNVFESLCHRLVDRPVDLLSPKTVITLFQYITFFAEEDRRHPEKFINDLTKEFELTASLEPGNPDLPKTVKKIPKAVMLPTGNLRALSLLLLEDSTTVQTGVRMYYESISTEIGIRQKVITVYLECLEERDQALRQAGCAALAAMQATESLDQLVYLLRCDVDDVKTTAKVALMAFGEKGRLAYETISFPSYGDYPPYPIEPSPSAGTPLQTTEL